jgi:hypothetical protein
MLAQVVDDFELAGVTQPVINTKRKRTASVAIVALWDRGR